MYLWIMKSLLNFGCHLDPDSGFGLRIWTEYALAEVCDARMHLFNNVQLMCLYTSCRHGCCEVRTNLNISCLIRRNHVFSLFTHYDTSK